MRRPRRHSRPTRRNGTVKSRTGVRIFTERRRDFPATLVAVTWGPIGPASGAAPSYPRLLASLPSMAKSVALAEGYPLLWEARQLLVLSFILTRCTSRGTIVERAWSGLTRIATAPARALPTVTGLPALFTKLLFPSRRPTTNLSDSLSFTPYVSSLHIQREKWVFVLLLIPSP